MEFFQKMLQAFHPSPSSPCSHCPHQFLLQWFKTAWPSCVPANPRCLPRLEHRMDRRRSNLLASPIPFGPSPGAVAEPRPTAVTAPLAFMPSALPLPARDVPLSLPSSPGCQRPGLPAGVKTGQPFVCEPFPALGSRQRWHGSPAFQHLPSRPPQRAALSRGWGSQARGHRELLTSPGSRHGDVQPGKGLLGEPCSFS